MQRLEDRVKSRHSLSQKHRRFHTFRESKLHAVACAQLTFQMLKFPQMFICLSLWVNLVTSVHTNKTIDYLSVMPICNVWTVICISIAKHRWGIYRLKRSDPYLYIPIFQTFCKGMGYYSSWFIQYRLSQTMSSLRRFSCFIAVTWARPLCVYFWLFASWCCWTL